MRVLIPLIIFLVYIRARICNNFPTEMLQLSLDNEQKELCILGFHARKIFSYADVFCDFSRAFNTQFVSVSWKGEDIKNDSFCLPQNF